MGTLLQFIIMRARTLVSCGLLGKTTNRNNMLLGKLPEVLKSSRPAAAPWVPPI